MSWNDSRTSKFHYAETVAAFDKIGKGMKLVIPRDGTGAKLISDPRYDPQHKEEMVSDRVLEDLLGSGLLIELTEHGEPPVSKRKPREGYRIGWKEAGLPGEQYRIFVCVQ